MLLTTLCPIPLWCFQNNLKTMLFTQIDFGSPEYDEALALRYKLLREPLNLEYDPSQIELEWMETHFGILDTDLGLIANLTFQKLNETTLKMRQVVVSNKMQNKGLGLALVDFAECWAKHNGFQEIKLHARSEALDFYKKINYRVVGVPFTEVNILHYEMKKQF